MVWKVHAAYLKKRYRPFALPPGEQLPAPAPALSVRVVQAGCKAEGREVGGGQECPWGGRCEQGTCARASANSSATPAAAAAPAAAATPAAPAPAPAFAPPSSPLVEVRQHQHRVRALSWRHALPRPSHRLVQHRHGAHGEGECRGEA